LKKGVELYQKVQPEVVSYYDIVHLVSRVIKSIFESDSRWESYRQACCRCANFLRQSLIAHLKPPRPKTKARYMNYDREVRWAVRALNVLARVRSGQMNDRQSARLIPEVVEQRLGWLDEYRERASVWLEVICVGQSITGLVRQTGYTANTADQIRRLGESVRYEESRTLVSRVADEVAPFCRTLDGNESMPGSTEVLESLIGKGKRLLHHSGNSVTRQILALAAATTQITTELVTEALSHCRMKHLKEWAKDNFRLGIHAVRREDLPASEEETNLRNRIASAIPNF